MTHSFSRLLAITIVVLGIFLVQVESIQSQTFDREAMLEGMITETILPLHTTFAEQATTLSTTALDFQADPTPETLATLQSAWVETSIAYGHIEVYRFRRVMPFINQLNSIPPNIEFIEIYIDDNVSIDANLAASLGSQLKGLATLEYLIFTDDAISLLTGNEARMAYMSAIATDIKRVADELVVQWTLDAGGYGDRFLSADGEPNSVRSSISMLSNEMIAILEDVTSIGLGVPLGYENRGEVQPARVYAPYSNTTRDRLVANIEGFEMAFNGLDESPSLADYLDFLGAELDGEAMSTVINQNIETTITALDAIEQPVQIAVSEDNETVTIAYNNTLSLLRLVKTDMANQLGITVTFSDNDGD